MAPLVEKAQVRLQIRGRVQGVYFRASLAQQAQALGLTGWVMNCGDGSVAAAVEGSRGRLEELISWCWQGPPGARVADVSVEWDRAHDSFIGFVIKR